MMSDRKSDIEIYCSKSSWTFEGQLIELTSWSDLKSDWRETCWMSDPPLDIQRNCLRLSWTFEWGSWVESIDFPEWLGQWPESSQPKCLIPTRTLKSKGLKTYLDIKIWVCKKPAIISKYASSILHHFSILLRTFPSIPRFQQISLNSLNTLYPVTNEEYQLPHILLAFVPPPRDQGQDPKARCCNCGFTLTKQCDDQVCWVNHLLLSEEP